MLQALFHAWERRLADVTTGRVVRPFDWGLEWIPQNVSSSLPLPCVTGTEVETIRECVASEPAVSRLADAAGTGPRRLHRQRQCRADGADLQAGGARRAARDRVARVARLRSHRDSRHQSRVVPVAADHGARAADPRA